MQLEIQKCRLQHLTELTKIARSTFIDAFEALNNPDDFKHYLNTSLSKEKIAQELSNPDTSFFFITLGPQLAGYFKLNEHAAQTDLKVAEALEVERIYVLAKFQGKKIGEWAISEILKMALVKKKAYVWLGVWEHNTAAIRFYERLGFARFAMHPYYIGQDRQTDWLMKMNLIAMDSQKEYQ